ncbi:MAG: DEAD/DEAH box helicase, partial [Myxococcales bacterium]|nr:DEAD/DEAH box helicase [Myxococcales bacterium]
MHRIPGRPAGYGPWPDALDPSALQAAQAAGIERLYLHQSAAIEATLAGRDVVLATSTASGKSLCYQLPLLTATARDPRARGLLLFPTKALARDQIRSLRALAGDRLGAGVYDGDTPPDER